MPEPVFPQNELKEEKASDITGEALERELFGGAAVTGMVDGGEGLSRQTAKIDKFYTFNRKNEEFQKLLDDEYDKFRSGKPLDDTTFAANVEAIKEKEEMRQAQSASDEVAFANKETSVFQPISDEPVAVSIEKSPTVTDEEKIREMFGQAPAAVAGAQAAGAVAQAEDKKQTAEEKKLEAAEKRKQKQEERQKAREAKKAEKAAKKAEKAGDGAAAVGGAEKATDKAASEGDKKAQGTVGKIIIIILSVILALLIIALGLKIIAPDSILSQKIDNVADGVMTVFTGEDETENTEDVSTNDESRESFDGDLTGVIQGAVGDNFNGLIGQINFDPELTFEKKKSKIKDKNLLKSMPVTDNIWYAREDGGKLYLDEALVKHMVRFESQWQSLIREGREAVLSLVEEDTPFYDQVDNSFETNPTSEFKQLDIGEIRKGDGGTYYVFVRETKEDTKEYAYLIVDDNRNMQTRNRIEL